MNMRCVQVGVCVMGLVWTASGALAATPEARALLAEERLVQAGSQNRPPARGTYELRDNATAVVMRLARAGAGALQLDIEGDGLEVRKVSLPNGDFNIRMKWDTDVLVLVRTGDRLRASRRGQTAVISMSQPDQSGFEGIQQVLAGSIAARQFRILRRMVSPATIETGIGAAVEMVDSLVGLLQGEASPIRPRQAKRVDAPVSLMASEMEAGDGGSCYSGWESEVLAAWTDYESCVNSFSWWNPCREVCAFLWVIRVESAWFKLIGCSAIPLKADLDEVSCEGPAD